MFNYFSKVWTDRLSSEQWTHHEDLTLPVVPINPQRLDELALEDWELAGVDFHCSNVLDQLKAKRDRETHGPPFTHSEADLKSAMWHLSSSVTNKELVPYSLPKVPHTKLADLEHLWKDIEDDVKVLQEKILRERK